LKVTTGELKPEDTLATYRYGSRDSCFKPNFYDKIKLVKS